MNTPKLSVAIITYNEEKNIERCLASIAELADEIIVVDSHSTDKTEQLCAPFGVRFIKNPFQGHIEQKNFALELCQHEFILSLDADEALSPELSASISHQKGLGFPQIGYHFNRLTQHSGHWVRFCGWYPDQKLRLIARGKGRWMGLNPHDILTLHQGQSSFLKGDLLHYSYNSLSEHVAQTNKFTTIAAKAAYKEGKRSSVFKIVTRPGLKFLRDYFWKQGFRDGRMGFIICCVNALSALLKYAKLYDLERKKRID
jgi:glycosyltransferase involved in cell wall biosynthesis